MNIFLTGEKQVGKSTIINSVTNELGISEKIIGFRTLLNPSAEIRTFYIEPINISLLENPYKDIGYFKDGKKTGITSTFEDYGVKLLKKCLSESSSMVLLDEVGFFEEGARNFQKKLHELLDSPKTVLGVIKEHTSEFLDSIRFREDVRILHVTLVNREEIKIELIKIIKNLKLEN